MERTDRDNRPTDPERKWIRLQEIGLAQFLAIPIVILVVGILTGWTVKGPAAPFTANILIVVTLFLVSSGGICFKTGYDKRVELRDQEDK